MHPDQMLGRTAPVLILSLVTLVLAAGCGGDKQSNVLSPAFQPEVTNQTDSFQFQATNVTNLNQILTYTWRNTGTQANVDQSSSITAGTATLSLRDSTGAQVYTRSLTEGGSLASAVGVTGNWTIRVTLTGVRGTLNFRVQKKT